MAPPLSDMLIQRLSLTEVSLLGELLEVYREAFGIVDFIPPPAAYMADLLRDEKIIFLVAIHHRRVIGGLTAYILPSLYYPASEVYLYDLAVGTPWQRQGIGTALLAALKEQSETLGIKEIFVQADRPDKHAIDFYTRNDGIPEDVIHFSFAIGPRSL